jgi:methyltransferase (TIGR00027 family)
MPAGWRLSGQTSAPDEDPYAAEAGTGQPLPGLERRWEAHAVDQASRTAVYVCQGRAVANGRLAVGRFADPIAARLLLPHELAPVELARAGEQPAALRDRLVVESVRACAEVVAPRTVAIDDAIGEADHAQVVLVGAGLDARPWRLTSLSRAVVFAVDHPASQADARARSAGLSPVAGRLEFVAADLGAGELTAALSAAGHDPDVPTSWVWEGVVPYLTEDEVRATVADLGRLSAPRSVLVVNYQSRSPVATWGRRLSRLLSLVPGYESPLRSEPWRSLWTPERMRMLQAEAGFAVRADEDLLSLARGLGTPTSHAGSLGNGRVAVAVHG